MMKPVRKRAKGAGNSKPQIRKGFPETNLVILEEKMDSYVRLLGKEQAFNLHQYKHLQPQQAEVPRDIYKLCKLLESLLAAQPTGQIKYASLKQALGGIMKKFGHDILAAHFECENALLPGRCADSLIVLLKHWRRVTATEKSWEKFQRSLDRAQASVMEGLRKGMALDNSEVSIESKKRTLNREVSDVSVGPDGFPSMLATQSDPEDSDCGPSTAESAAPGASESCLGGSPPPVLKKDWRAAAGKELKKKPAGKGCSAQGPPLKKPAAKAKGGPDLIHQPSLKLGGGKNQSYIQHMPDGPGTSLRLIIACTAARAKFLKISHKALMEELLPKCKEKGATKASIFAERDKLYKKYERSS